MRRGWLAVALLLSLGVNLGLAGAVLWRSRARPEARLGPGTEPGGRLAGWVGVQGPAREEFLAVQRRLAETVVAERREMTRLRRELRAELLAESPERARLDSLLAELGERERTVDRAFVDSVLDSRRLLSGRARERYLRFVERFEAARGSRHGAERAPLLRRRLGRESRAPSSRD